MKLSAALLDTFDRCPRRAAFEREYESTSISPLRLLYAGVLGSLVATNALEGSREAMRALSTRYSVSGGDLSSLSAARHIAATAEVIALALRDKFGQGTKPKPVKVEGHGWNTALVDCGGVLRRVILASHMDDDTLRSYAHAWGTIGELAAMERPITLTVVLIGSRRQGRWNSHWTRAFQHPIRKSMLRFASRKRDDGFTKGWSTVWREQTQISAEDWMNGMRSDGVMDDLIVSRAIAYNGEDQRMKQARCDIARMAEEMSSLPEALELPMRRSSCDEVGRSPCPFQAICYASTLTHPSEVPALYRELESRGDRS